MLHFPTLQVVITALAKNLYLKCFIIMNMFYASLFFILLFAIFIVMVPNQNEADIQKPLCTEQNFELKQ